MATPKQQAPVIVNVNNGPQPSQWGQWGSQPTVAQAVDAPPLDVMPDMTQLPPMKAGVAGAVSAPPLDTAGGVTEERLQEIKAGFLPSYSYQPESAADMEVAAERDNPQPGGYRFVPISGDKNSFQGDLAVPSADAGPSRQPLRPREELPGGVLPDMTQLPPRKEGSAGAPDASVAVPPSLMGEPPSPIRVAEIINKHSPAGVTQQDAEERAWVERFQKGDAGVPTTAADAGVPNTGSTGAPPAALPPGLLAPPSFGAFAAPASSSMKKYQDSTQKLVEQTQAEKDTIKAVTKELADGLKDLDTEEKVARERARMANDNAVKFEMEKANSIQQTQQRFAAAMEERKKLMNQNIDPSRYWNNKEDWQKAMAIIAGALYGFVGKGMEWLNHLEGLVTRDIEAQKSDRTFKAGILADEAQAQVQLGDMVSKSWEARAAASKYQEAARLEDAKLAIMRQGQLSNRADVKLRAAEAATRLDESIANRYKDIAAIEMQQTQMRQRSYEFQQEMKFKVWEAQLRDRREKEKADAKAAGDGKTDINGPIEKEMEAEIASMNALARLAVLTDEPTISGRILHQLKTIPGFDAISEDARVAVLRDEQIKQLNTQSLRELLKSVINKHEIELQDGSTLQPGEGLGVAKNAGPVFKQNLKFAIQAYDSKVDRQVTEGRLSPERGEKLKADNLKRINGFMMETLESLGIGATGKTGRAVE